MEDNELERQDDAPEVPAENPLEEPGFTTPSDERVLTLSLSEHGTNKLSTNFEVREFACHDGSDEILVDTRLVGILQRLRDWASSPVIIRSGYRTKAYNSAVGGATSSRHMRGLAADIVVPGMTPESVAQWLEKQPEAGGVGRYDTFTHIDVDRVYPDRPRKWDERKKR